MSITWKILATWLLLVMLTASHSGFSWNTAVSSALTIGVLACVIYVSAASNWFLVWMIFVLYFGISWVNTLIEALVFHVLPPLIAFQSGTLGLTTAFTISVALCFSMGGMRPPDISKTAAPKGLVWKVAAGACLYFVLYIVAGMTVHPFIKAFYGNRWLPSLGQLFGIQFVRGMLYVAFALPFLRTMSGRRTIAGVMLGASYSVLGGLAPLLLSNAYMPVSVRLAHSFEVGISNFIFGFLVACLLVSRRNNARVVTPAIRADQ